MTDARFDNCCGCTTKALPKLAKETLEWILRKLACKDLEGAMAFLQIAEHVDESTHARLDVVQKLAHKVEGSI